MLALKLDKNKGLAKGLEFIDIPDVFLSVYFTEALIQNIPNHTASFFVINMFNYGPMLKVCV